MTIVSTTISYTKKRDRKVLTQIVLPDRLGMASVLSKFSGCVCRELAIIKDRQRNKCLPPLLVSVSLSLKLSFFLSYSRLIIEHPT